jgi:hypothetical protein
MKPFFFITLIGFCFNFRTYGQVNHPLLIQDTANIYYQCLLKHLKSLNKPAYINIQESVVTEKLPTKIGELKVNYLTNEMLIKEIKSKKSIYLISIQPITGSLNSLSLNIVDFLVGNNSRGLKFENSGGSYFSIKFNCNVNKNEIILLSNGGF